ncbi:Na(+)/H(+) antiporter subunit A [Marinomonas aquimarina]|uniref:Na(+)/H(+) antiporter subunit A n=1 Tax=Marinomonas aquimarina TaxID=295068 RepID=A0A1A8TKC4_9GAMM|nr:hydrogen gas-evolving membrane-bound hydrogenase subunit E [Marinomonas aquimarina]SBS33391.1 Na(+)/H(+) antiporter subunit A [Marinomonas aquimarina]
MDNITDSPETPNSQKHVSLLIFPLIPIVLLFSILSWYQPEGVSWQGHWIPGLDINLSFRLDGLSFLFAGLITGIGALIQFYALAYMRGDGGRFSFHLYLTLFMLSMLGLVTSDNILLLFVFWELTTITSYLLIGFNHEQNESRKKALQSLLVTGAGGLAFLAGLIFLGQMAGSYEVSVILQQTEQIADHPWFVTSLLLILLGVFTKSAQFPFHFWLPNAMAAPTPVSAYLHSATMVKAGVYLLARLSPVYSDSEVWFYALVIVGGFTAIWCALLAIKQTDLKLMLAYSTNVALGELVLLIGIGTEFALTAALLFILAHSFYKAALFMVVGNIDKATGTRDIRKLHGLRAVLVLSLVAAILAALSKSGVPPLLGFLSKEYMYKSGLEASGLITAVLMLANVFMVALAIAIIYKPFFANYQREPIVVKQVESSKGLWLPAMLLAVGSVAAPVLGLGWLNSQIIIPGVISSLPAATPDASKFWHGINLPLLLSVLTLLLGGAVYALYPRWLAKQKKAILPNAEAVFDLIMNGLMRLATWQTRCLQQKRLSNYVLMFSVVLAVILLSQPLMIAPERLMELFQLNFYEIAIALLLISAALVCTLSHSRLLAVASLSMVGFMTTLVFMLYSAADVAKTLLLVETLMVVFVVLLMRHMPRLTTVVRHSKKRRLLHAVIAGGVGLSVSALLINITAQPLDPTLAQFFANNSLPEGHGRNIVNVILVDFRAIDTLGEMIVVVIAGIAAISLLSSQNYKRAPVHSLIFTTTAQIVSTLMLVFSVYLLMRGHNEPGGGFIGALIAVIGLALLMFAKSPKYVRDRLHYSPMGIAMFGICLSFIAGLLSMAFHLPFLTGLWWKDVLPLGTPLLFDVGIYFAIIGGVMGILLRVNEVLD